jgi:putative transposon-encoded protein
MDILSISMSKVKTIKKNKLLIENIEGFIKRKVVPVGNSAKVNCPKEYLEREVYLVILKK